MMPHFFPTFSSQDTGIKGLLYAIGHLVWLLIPIAGGLAFVYFFWGLGKFILKSDSEEAQKEGRQMMIWGIVAIFLIVTVWGVVGFIGQNLGIYPIWNLPVNQ